MSDLAELRATVEALVTTHTFIIPGKPVGWRQNHAGRIVGMVRGKPKIAVTSHLATRPKDSPSPATNFPKGWKKMAAEQLALEWRGVPIAQAVMVAVWAVFPRAAAHDCTHKPHGLDPARKKPCSCPPEKLDGRARWHTSVSDYTNVKKLAEDALVAAGVLEDDRFTCVPGGIARYAARGEEPHVRIVVELLPEFPTPAPVRAEERR